MAGVDIKGLGKEYLVGDRLVQALHDINLKLEEESFTVVVGKSGSGKTTLLRLLGGLEKPTRGAIDFTLPRSTLPTQTGRVGIMFQEPRLMPWLTVKENIGLGRDKRETGKDQAVEYYVNLLGLTDFEEAYPHQISGGMAQRAALGRTLCYDPDVVLMDEPFGALDYFTRIMLQKEIVDLFLSQHKTIVFVTHDVEEAVFLGQRIVVLEAGQLAGIFNVNLPYPRNITASSFLALRETIFQAIVGDTGAAEYGNHKLKASY